MEGLELNLRTEAVFISFLKKHVLANALLTPPTSIRGGVKSNRPGMAYFASSRQAAQLRMPTARTMPRVSHVLSLGNVNQSATATRVADPRHAHTTARAAMSVLDMRS